MSQVGVWVSGSLACARGGGVVRCDVRVVRKGEKNPWEDEHHVAVADGCHGRRCKP